MSLIINKDDFKHRLSKEAAQTGKDTSGIPQSVPNPDTPLPDTSLPETTKHDIPIQRSDVRNGLLKLKVEENYANVADKPTEKLIKIQLRPIYYPINRELSPRHMLWDVVCEHRLTWKQVPEHIYVPDDYLQRMREDKDMKTIFYEDHNGAMKILLPDGQSISISSVRDGNTIIGRFATNLFFATQRIQEENAIIVFTMF